MDGLRIEDFVSDPAPGIKLDGVRLASYEDVNGAWPVDLPAITAVFGERHARKLIRHFGGRAIGLPWYLHRSPGYNVSMGSTTKTRNRRSSGWRRLVHDSSHFVFEELHPTMTTHSARHAGLELSMIEYVVAQGWLALAPVKAKPAPNEKRAKQLAQVQASIKRWTTKAKRAATALKKLRAKEKRIARHILLAGGGE